MYRKRIMTGLLGCLLGIGGFFSSITTTCAEVASDYSQVPPFVTAGVPPMVMLVLDRDHKLYYEAYNDASDLNGDGNLDVGYKPAIDYYGYFDSYKCYEYNSGQSRFEPQSTSANKKCSGANAWSGDFLNYLTMSRMDCLRKVLYGGYRSVDTASETVLRRAFIPQDAHTWGKEYKDIANDGFDIREYTPLDLPQAGTRHLFASTALSDNGNPLLRVLPNNTHRIWEWVSKERPVADSSLASGGTSYTGNPADHAAFEALIAQFATAGHLLSQGSVSTIEQTSNRADYYITVITGNITITTGGSYQFAVDGDDAVEVLIDGALVVGWYGGHGKCSCHDHSATLTLTAGSHTVEFRHQEATGDDNYNLQWKGPDSKNNKWEVVPDTHLSNLSRSFYDVIIPGSTITDYIVQVLVGVTSMPEKNCKQYPSGNYKPVGILQKNGESDRMHFGLMTGSYAKNTSGGVLRKNIGTINDELNTATGQFTAVNGIIQAINKLRITGYDYGGYSYNQNCGWIATRAVNEGECRMWGNPIAEIMYETLRYFSGVKQPTPDFLYSGSTDDSTLGLPLATWQDPYDFAATGHSHCSRPFMLVISDIYPSYDTDQLPGSAFSTFSGSTLGTLNVQTLADFISGYEGIAGPHYIGESKAVTPSTDNSCSAKTVTGFGNIRGLCPEEPTKQGGYYAPSVSYHGRKEDINPAQGIQNVVTYTVGLASPKPQIKIPVGSRTITLVPFAKSVGGYSISATKGDFQPTNTLVDFYVDTITPTYGKFRINFEDVEQGADHDMDAIVIYEYQVSGTSVTVKLTSEYAAGSIIQHMGYIISGTTADGTYLEVRDTDTAAGSDPDYFLDTPPGGAWNDGTALPLTHERTFDAGTGTTATLIENPLLYAAKWGGYEENPSDANDIPDQTSEWDKDNNNIPDNYFYVTNPLYLEEQLNKSFADILRRAASGTAASVISNSRSGEGAIYQAIFYTEYKDSLGNKVNWVGELHSLFVDAYGNIREDSNGSHKLDPADDYVIEFSTQSVGTILKYSDVNGNGRLDGNEHDTPVAISPSMRDCRPDEIQNTPPPLRQCVAYLWSASSWLNGLSAANIENQRTVYIGTEEKRHIFTLADANMNMIPDTGEIVPFVDSSASIYPYIHLYPPFVGGAPAYIQSILSNYATQPAPFDDFKLRQSKRVINYIRGEDQASYTSAIAPVYTIPAFRSRQVDFDNDGQVETCRLGDIVYSTPTIVARPAENFDLLYKDKSYADLYRKYKNRRTVVYAGANDGMLHAFNGGFYDPSHQKFWKSYDAVTRSFPASNAVDIGPKLGAELWAYVPYNLLPHLYWLTEPGYNQDMHIAYVDLKPRIFDAKIFANDATHPNGWGTVLVCGMRLGGGKIRADISKTDGAYNPAVDRTMTSAYFIMDITDPESPPTLLAEISSDTLGFTTCYPTVITMKDLVPALDGNNWYLVLGSGLISANGADGTALADAASTQPARLFLLDLKQLTAAQPAVSTLNSSGVVANGMNVYAELDPGSFISDPITVDYQLDYKADAVYFGTVSGTYATGWGGKLRRIVINNDTTPSNWTKDSTLIDLTTIAAQPHGQPIVAAPTVALDQQGRRWIFFGTGRFFNRLDATHATASDQQSYYGIKEPKNAAGTVFTWGTVSRGFVSAADPGLLDVSSARVFEGGDSVQGVTGVTNFAELQTATEAKSGWLLNFSTAKERNLGQATVLGDILTFTTYIPSTDPCQFEGTSNLYALYFSTGTAYTKPVVGLGSAVWNGKHEVLSSESLGPGLSLTVNIHTGKEAGSTSFVQTSTGTILQINESNPGTVKSGKTCWKEWNE